MFEPILVLTSSPHLFQKCNHLLLAISVCVHGLELITRKPCVLDVDAARSATRRVVFGVPLSQRERDTELTTLFAPKEDPPLIISSNGSREELTTREEGETRGEKNSDSTNQSLAQENMPTPSKQQSVAISPHESRGSVMKKDASIEERQHYISNQVLIPSPMVSCNVD